MNLGLNNPFLHTSQEQEQDVMTLVRIEVKKMCLMVICSILIPFLLTPVVLPKVQISFQLSNQLSKPYVVKSFQNASQCPLPPHINALVYSPHSLCVG